MAKWFSAGVVASPPANTVLAATNNPAHELNGQPLVTPTGDTVFLVLGTTVAGVFALDVMTAASAIKKTQLFPCPANGLVQMHIPFPIEMAEGEWLRLRNNAANTGSMQGSIYTG